MTRKLTTDEIATIAAMGGTRGTAARFTANGCGFNPVTGESTSRGSNVIYQTVYWDLSREQAHRIADLTGSNLQFQDVGPNQAELDAIRERQIAEHVATVKATGSACRCAHCRTGA